MARPETLIPGNCYFMVGFHDRDLVFPYISTLRYLRCEVDSDHGRRWLFEEPNEPPKGEQDAFVYEVPLALSDEQLYQILDFPALLEELRAVAADHPRHATPSDNAALANSLPSDLREKIETFLKDPQYASLTVTILFTQDALSLRRRQGGYEIGFFPRPRRAPEEEQKIRALFASLGVAPHTDYLADKGRTRILAFPVSGELDGLLSLCGRVLTEVHAIRTDDRLKYTFLKAADVA